MTNRERAVFAAITRSTPPDIFSLTASYTQNKSFEILQNNAHDLLYYNRLPEFKPCECYYVDSKFGARCLGTKEREMCSCQADTSMCNFYDSRW